MIRLLAVMVCLACWQRSAGADDAGANAQMLMSPAAAFAGYRDLAGDISTIDPRRASAAVTGSRPRVGDPTLEATRELHRGAKSNPAPFREARNGSARTGTQAVQALVGNTIKGFLGADHQTAVFFVAGGALVVRNDNETLTGRWSVNGEELCTTMRDHQDCFGIEVDGNRVTLTPHASGTRLFFDLLPGDARGL